MTRLRKMMAALSVTAVAALATAAGVERGGDSAAARNAAPATTRTSSAPLAIRSTASIPPVSLLAARPISDSYGILLRRSIFAKDHRAAGIREPLISHPASAESKLIYLGAMVEGTRYRGAIEDTEGRKTIWIYVGDKLSEGSQVREITLDHLIVEKNGVQRRVEVSESMEGRELSVAQSTTPRPTAAASATTPAATASSAETASESSLEEMMRRRRIQELGQ